MKFVLGCCLFLTCLSHAAAQRQPQNTLQVMFDKVQLSLKAGTVSIEWTNLTERELICYIIERSSDAQGFQEVSRVLPRSNENQPESYVLTDKTPLPGLSFYRIRVNEQSGKTIYSKVMKLEASEDSKKFSVYPNPVTNAQFTWSVSGIHSGQFQLTIVTMNGVPLYRETVAAQGRALSQTLDLPATVRPGIYQLVITGADLSVSQCFNVQ